MKSRRYTWLLILLTPCLILLTPCLLLTGGTAWLVASNSGLQWLLGVAASKTSGQLSTKGVSGSLLDSFGMQQLVWRSAGSRISFQDVRLKWRPAALLHGELQLLHLSVREIQVLTAPSDTPLALPDSLRLPLSVSLLQLKVNTLSVFSSEDASPDFVVNDIEARLLGGANHLQLQELRAHLPYGDFSGSGEIALDKPYVFKAQASLAATVQLSEKSEQAHFIAKADGDLQHLDIKFDGNGAGISANGIAQLSPFSNILISYLQLTFKGVDADRIFGSAPSTLLSGNIDLHGASGGELEGRLQVRNAHAAPLDENGLPLQSVKAQVQLSPSSLRLQQLDVSLLNDGHVAGTLSWQEQSNILDMQLKVHGLDPAILDARLPVRALHGEVKLDGTGDNQQAVITLSDGTLDLFAEIERQGNHIELQNISLKRGDSVLSGYGEIALDRRRSFRFFSKLRKLNLADLAAIPATDLNTDMELSGTLSPEIEGNLLFNLSDSHYAQSDISGNASIEFTEVRQAEAAAEINLGDNYLKLNITYGTDADHARLILDAPKLAQLGNGLGGHLTANVDLSGSLIEPRLQFSAQGSDIVLPDGQSMAELDATGDLAPAAMKLNLGVKGYRGKSTLNIPEANISLQGSGAQHKLLVSASISQDDDTLGDLALKLNGGLGDPAQGWKNMQWQGELTGLTAQGVMPLQLSASAPLTISRNMLQLGAVNVAISGGHIKFSDTQWTPQGWHSAGSFAGLGIRAMNIQQTKLVSAEIEPLRLGGTWDVLADEHLQGSFLIQRESGDWIVDGNRGLRLGLDNMQLSAHIKQNQLHAKFSASGDSLGDIAVLGSVPLTRDASRWTLLPNAPLIGSLRLNSKDLSWLGPMIDSNLQSGGNLHVNARLGGSFLSPRLFGLAIGNALSLNLLDQVIRLEQGRLAARFESDGVHIDRLSFLSPHLLPPSDKLLANYKLPVATGKLNASGRIDLDGGSGNLEIIAEYLPLTQRADRWIIASGRGHVRYANKTLILGGDIRADAGLINQPVTDRPRWSEDVQIIGQETASRAGPKNIVNANLDLGDHFYIRASGLEARLAGQLKVRGEPGEPLQVTGIITAQDAVFNAYGQRLKVERGIVNFQGPFADPGLNILAMRKGLKVEAGVEVTGTVRRPTVRLVSRPNVPDAEKLSWIVLGRVPESDGVDSALLLAAAGNILGSQPVGKLGQALGVDEISLSQQTDENAQSSQKVTVGKRLSTRSHISYEHGLSDVGGVTKFTYTLTPRITIVTRTGTEDALDLFYSFHFY